MTSRVMRGLPVLVGVLVVLASCNAHDSEFILDNDLARYNKLERAALERMRGWIHRAVPLLNRDDIRAAERARLRVTINEARAAFDAYSRLREQGYYQTYVMAGIRASAAGIVANDAVGAVADDVLLIPLALAAIATYAITDRQATAAELGQAWNRVLARSGELAVAVDHALAMVAVGNVADTGIMDEVYALLAEKGLSLHDRDNICRALAWLQAATTDQKRLIRIRRTQKAQDCRPSRHSKDR